MELCKINRNTCRIDENEMEFFVLNEGKRTAVVHKIWPAHDKWKKTTLRGIQISIFNYAIE